MQFEAAILRDLVIGDRARRQRRILPVLLPGAVVEDIPQWLGPHSGSRYPVTEFNVAGAEGLLRVLLARPAFPELVLGTPPELGPVGPPVGLVLRHELVAHVRVEAGDLVTRVVLAGTDLGERRAPLPAGLGVVWAHPDRDLAGRDARLDGVGRGLYAAMFDEAVRADLVRLVDESAYATVITVVIVAEGAAAGLPLELLRLTDGRLVATLPGVRMLRRIAGVDRAATAPLPGPLKILAAVAAPDETRTQSPPLDVEAEMQAVVDAVGAVQQHRDGQVQLILEVAGVEQIAAALKTDQYHVLHLSAHGSPTSVELEDEDGNPVTVEAAKLVPALRGAGRPLPLIVLSSCAGAGSGLHGLAATLVRQGADRVVAMQTSVTDTYATGLAGELYAELADHPDACVAQALAEARRTMEERRTVAARQGLLLAPEYAVATLVASDGDPPLRDPKAESVPLMSPATIAERAVVRELPVGYLIGRRRELRQALGVLRGHPAARDRFGVMAGVVLTGIGGSERPPWPGGSWVGYVGRVGGSPSMTAGGTRRSCSPRSLRRSPSWSSSKTPALRTLPSSPWSPPHCSRQGCCWSLMTLSRTSPSAGTSSSTSGSRSCSPPCARSPRLVGFW